MQGFVKKINKVPLLLQNLGEAHINDLSKLLKMGLSLKLLFATLSLMISGRKEFKLWIETFYASFQQEYRVTIQNAFSHQK